MIPLSKLAQHCHREISRYRNGESYDPGYGYDLFQRALVGKDEQAWTWTYELYHPLVSYWVERSSSFGMTDEESSYFVNRAFEKMWHSISEGKFTHFPNLKSLMQYLKMCVNSILIDHVRAQKSMMATLAYEEIAKRTDLHDPSLVPTSKEVDEYILDEMQGNTLWQQIEMRLANEHELLVMHGSYILALKPRELYDEYPDKFSSVNQVYRVKQNVLARLRRDQELREALRAFF